MVKTPIILYNWGDVEVFGNLEQLERHLEPVDVNNGEYLLFDCEGRILEVLVVDGTNVVVRPASSESRFQAQLTHMLQWFLERAKTVPPAGARLEQLIHTVASFQHRKGR